MEETLRLHLLSLFDAYKAATNTPHSATGRQAARDHMIHARLMARTGSFTVSTYDRLVEWFSMVWPAGTTWPADVLRPSPATPARRNSFDFAALQADIDSRPHYDMGEHGAHLGISAEMLISTLGGQEPPDEVRAKIEARLAVREPTPCQALSGRSAA